MNLKLRVLIVAGLSLFILTACSPSNPLPPAPASPETQSSGINNTNDTNPLGFPTYAIPQPANINPGKFIGTVYISDQDKKFHRAGCPNLGPNPTTIARTSAMVQGYTADPFCNP